MMCRHLCKAAPVVLALVCLSSTCILAQPAKRAGSQPDSSPDKAIALAERGQCRESIIGLKHGMTAQFPADTRKQAGVLGVRCSLAVDDRDAALEFLRLLNKQF